VVELYYGLVELALGCGRCTCISELVMPMRAPTALLVEENRGDASHSGLFLEVSRNICSLMRVLDEYELQLAGQSAATQVGKA
jgi:hypothetical protein